jgi:hypothetical protein
MTDSNIFVTAPVQATIVVTPPTPATIVRSTSGPQGPAGIAGPPGVTPVFTRSGMLEVDAGRSRFYADRDLTITRIRAAVGTPAIGAAIIVDVLLDELVIATVEIPDGEHTGLLDVDETFTIGQYVTVDITQVGSTGSGHDLTVTITTE